jgi:3-deoxy-manno-octulosonate cytidylyltransferase (CMP-KDO synthetase)
MLAVIPSRYPSQRLPGKPLADIAGKPLVQWVFEAASQAGIFARTLVATDDQRIMDAVAGFGGEAMLTSDQHQTGTDRVAEVARRFPDMDVIVNVQGDQPFITSSILRTLVRPYFEDISIPMTTIACPLKPEGHADPSCVKVACDQQGNALFFTRAAIPVYRQQVTVPVHHHLGLYAFSRKFLEIYAHLTPTPLEQAEQLEQLRVLEHGFRIRLTLTDSHFPEVNTPEELEQARVLMKARL